MGLPGLKARRIGAAGPKARLWFFVEVSEGGAAGPKARLSVAAGPKARLAGAAGPEARLTADPLLYRQNRTRLNQKKRN